jgi:hypothetical protein
MFYSRGSDAARPVHRGDISMGERNETNTAKEANEKLDLVVRSLKRTRNKLGCGFLLVLGIGVGMIVGGTYSDEASLALIIFGVICVLLAALGGKTILPNLSPANSPLMKLLQEHPENIAWIYTVRDPGSGGIYGRCTNITVNDTDKNAHTFSVKDKNLEEMMGILKSFAPRAAIGLDKELQEKFAQDPWSVMADE